MTKKTGNFKNTFRHFATQTSN